MRNQGSISSWIGALVIVSSLTACGQRVEGSVLACVSQVPLGNVSVRALPGGETTTTRPDGTFALTVADTTKELLLTGVGAEARIPLRTTRDQSRSRSLGELTLCKHVPKGLSAYSAPLDIAPLKDGAPVELGAHTLAFWLMSAGRDPPPDSNGEVDIPCDRSHYPRSAGPKEYMDARLFEQALLDKAVVVKKGAELLLPTAQYQQCGFYALPPMSFRLGNGGSCSFPGGRYWGLSRVWAADYGAPRAYVNCRPALAISPAPRLPGFSKATVVGEPGLYAVVSYRCEPFVLGGGDCTWTGWGYFLDVKP